MKTKREMIELIEKYVQKKIEENPNIIIFSYFEVIVEMDIKKVQEEEFIDLAKNKLENIGFTVYLEGEMFAYKDIYRMVGDNEIVIGIRR